MLCPINRPQVGSLLIWVAKGFFKGTGHVAVITDVQVRAQSGHTCAGLETWVWEG